MSDAGVKPNLMSSPLTRGAISLVAVFAIIAVAFGDRFAPYLQQAAALNWVPHAPNLDLLDRMTPAIKIHLAAALSSLALGTALLIGVKGTTAHRTLGWVWVLLMLTAAASAFFIRGLNPNGLSFIHILAGWTLLVAPLGVFWARTHKVERHRRTMTGLFVGGLIVAGLLAFMPGRLMWQMFFG